jgi:hypothetical protein
MDQQAAKPRASAGQTMICRRLAEFAKRRYRCNGAKKVQVQLQQQQKSIAAILHMIWPGALPDGTVIRL